ncbi:hypothetical protein [Paraherbaspirillum soli]|uniref:Phenol degradation protein meta n=1 Tax=Paraherbaspirillum soli TaxID=631222 RepID=A0ABW0MBV7_9BURK
MKKQSQTQQSPRFKPAFFQLSRCAAAALLLTAGIAAHAHEGHDGADTPSPESHGPAGVMYDHMHAKGEWMFGYRFSQTRQGGGMQHGTDNVGNAELDAAGYHMKPTSMVMNMHMLDIMYAPTDWFNIMVMPMFMEMPMGMEGLPMMRHGMGPMTHSTRGMGDTPVSALFRLYDDGTHHVQVGATVSVPTGSVSEKNVNGKFTHYGMQLGSGTWDAMPSITYTGHSGKWNWGLQADAVLPMQDANASGYRLGNKLHLTGWGGYKLADWLNMTSRLSYTAQGAIKGEYNGPHTTGMPDDDTANYGGKVVEVGVGLNAMAGSGPLKGYRLGVEYVEPVAQNLNGFQLKRQPSLFLNVTKAF